MRLVTNNCQGPFLTPLSHSVPYSAVFLLYSQTNPVSIHFPDFRQETLWFKSVLFFCILCLKEASFCFLITPFPPVAIFPKSLIYFLEAFQSKMCVSKVHSIQAKFNSAEDFVLCFCACVHACADKQFAVVQNVCNLIGIIG